MSVRQREEIQEVLWKMSPAFRIPPAAWRLCGAVVSGILLATAFPPFKGAEAVWTALVPLLLVSRYSDPRTSFKYGFVSGLVFWLIDISWLLHLSQTGTNWPLAILGWLAASLYFALYFAAFAMTVSLLWNAGRKQEQPDNSGKSNGKREVQNPFAGLFEPDSLLRNVALLLAIPMLWVGFEYLRSVIFTGLSWNQIGISQYRNMALIQLAEWGGVYTLSALIMMMNVAVAVTIVRFARIYTKRIQSRRLSIELMIALVVCASCWIYGYRTAGRVCRDETPRTEVKIAAVQPNIPQLKKWDDEAINEIYESLLNQTELVLRQPGIQLIVWPETSVPGPVFADPDVTDFVNGLTRRGVPILVGSLEVEMAGEKMLLYNTSFLFGPDGLARERYRKRHLVPFGEYIPFDKTFSFIENLAPLGFSCTAGETSTVFRLDNSPVTFSSLICFEDSIPGLAAESVRNGARLLITQTNDGWFDGTGAALQHMSHCVFRCVENRVPAVRCANTGITCFIDKAGRVDMLKNEENEWRFQGFQAGSVLVEGPEMHLTFYTKYGDLPFAIPCAVLAAMVFVLAVVREKRGKTALVSQP
jgi:apolipoprotein N-acyltransferase